MSLLSRRYADVETKTATQKQQSKMIENHKQTKTLRLNTIHADTINIHGKELKGCEPIHIYGQYSQYWNKDIKCRIGKVATVFKILRPMWISKKISERTRIKLSNSNVESVLLYACETWRTTQTSTHKLQTFINRCFRNYLKKWNWKNTLQTKSFRKGQNNYRRVP